MIDLVIVNYYLLKDTIRAAESALAQGEKVQVWVVDNSEDQAEAESLTSSLGDRCRVIINQKNVGFGVACNQVFSQSDGRWFYLLNPDSYLESGALRALRQFLESNPGAGAVAPRTYYDSEHHALLPAAMEQTPWTEFLEHPCGSVHGKITRWTSLLRYRDVVNYWKTNKPLKQRSLSGGGALLRRAAVENSGGLFDPQFFLYYEDTDLFRRMRKSGYGLYMEPSAVAVHAYGGTAQDRLQWKHERIAESRALYMEKHFHQSILHRWNQSIRCKRKWLPRIECLDMGVECDIPTIPWKGEGEWLLEWSYDPYFLVSVGVIGDGPVVQFPNSVWNLLSPGTWYARIGSSEKLDVGTKVWSFDKTA